MTSTNKKKIGILTAGGDCSGLNAVIRAATYAARQKGWQIFGLLENRDLTPDIDEDGPYIELLESHFYGPIFRTGGTMLGTARGDRTETIVSTYKQLDLDCLIVIGGDGSMASLHNMAQENDMKIVGVPKTIDNDVGATEVAIGFDTALSIATDGIDHLHPTAASHQRVMVIEVMGRDAGHIAMRSGIAGGADVILIPEIPYKMENIVNKIKTLRAQGQMHSLVVVSEAMRDEDGNKFKVQFGDSRASYGGVGHYFGTQIGELTGAETRVTVLGHTQRGGIPTANDRIMATAFGVHAVEFIDQGLYGMMVAWSGRDIHHVPISDVVDNPKLVDMNGPMVKTARAMGICLGDS